MQHARLATLATLSLISSCMGGSGSGTGSLSGSLQLTSMSVPSGAIWEINRPIDFVFNQPIDFSTVSLNSISIRKLDGAPASGSFSLIEPAVVRFQPTCPTQADLSDSGLEIGGVAYQVSLLAALGATSLTGAALESAQFSSFTTPASTLPSLAFWDAKPGAPEPLVRLIAPDGSLVNAGTAVSRIETLAGTQAPAEFSFDQAHGTFGLPLDQGLNLFSDSTAALRVIVELDQPVNPAAENISSERVFLEQLGPGGAWTAVPSTVELLVNCCGTGAALELRPQGILSQDRELRVVVGGKFEDIVGDSAGSAQDKFGHFRTQTAGYPGLDPEGDQADEIKEDFVLAGEELGSLEDLSAAFAEPRAVWGEGSLEAAFSFAGTGGADGAFDWVVPTGVQVLLDTSGVVTIQGGDIGGDMQQLDSFVASKQELVVGGTVNVRHLVIEEGASVRAVGINLLTISALGDILIRSTSSASTSRMPVWTSPVRCWCSRSTARLRSTS